MIHRFFLIIFSLPTLVLLSCDVKEDPAKQLSSFDRISANGGITFNLVQGSNNKVISTSLEDASYFVSNNQLSVNATGGSMTIAVEDFDLLWCNGCSIENTGALSVDTLNLYVHAGSIALTDINVTNFTSLVALKDGTYEFSGRTGLFQFSSVNNTFIKAYDFVADSVYITSQCVVDSEVHAKHVLNALIASAGNINYKGNPPTVRVTRTGLGRAIKN